MPAFLAVRLNADTFPVDPQECVELEQADAELLALEGETEQDIIQAARHCDALLVISAKVPAPVIEALSRCRVLSRLGAGTDRIDVRSATERGIVVANVPDFCVNEQAEHTMALLLGWVRQLPFMLDAMKQGNWNARHHPLVHRLAGRTVGLVGFGASAQGVAQRCSAMAIPGEIRYAGYTAWRAITRFPTAGLLAGETLGCGQRFGLVPIAGERVYWYATDNLPEGGREESGRAKARLARCSRSGMRRFRRSSRPRTRRRSFATTSTIAIRSIDGARVASRCWAMRRTR